MKKNTVLAKLREGKPSVGTWLVLCSPLAAEYMAHVGYDWLVVDVEHSPADMETVAQCFQAICTTPTIPMARASGNDPVLIKRLLDAGAMGVVVPMVNSPEAAERAVKAMKYPPMGFRSTGGGRGPYTYGSDYYSRANEEIAVIVQIEHIEAVRSVEAILSVPGIDVCFIGPNDLAASMGVPPRDPAHESAILAILAAARRARIPAGIHCLFADDVNARIAQGFQFIAHANEMRIMTHFAREELARIKR